MNKRLIKQRDNFEENDDRLVGQNTLTASDLNTLKELYNLTKPYCDFIAYIEGQVIIEIYNTLCKLLLEIHKIIDE